ncbi:MAG: ribosome maturation factor RimM [bacterium]
MKSVKLPDRISIGFVERAHGLKGEVRVKPLTDSPVRFNKLSRVFVELRSGNLLTFEIRKVVISGSHIFLCFKGVETREAALELKGASIQVHRKEVLPLKEDQFYIFEILNFEVLTTQGESLGWVAEVMDLSANAVLVVKKGLREFLIPMIRDVVIEINKQKKVIIIDPLEGLLD